MPRSSHRHAVIDTPTTRVSVRRHTSNDEITASDVELFVPIGYEEAELRIGRNLLQALVEEAPDWWFDNE